MNKYTIRTATSADTDTLLEIYAPYVENTAITFEYVVPSHDEFKNRIVQISKKYPYLVAEENHEIVGYAYANSFKPRAAYDWSVEATIYVKINYKGHGIGKALYSALEQALKQQNITNMNACIAVPEVDDEYLTHNSVQFHTHMGFQPVGTFHKCANKFHRWYNMIWMEKIIGEHLENPEIVKAYSEIKTI